MVVYFSIKSPDTSSPKPSLPWVASTEPPSGAPARPKSRSSTHFSAPTNLVGKSDLEKCIVPTRRVSRGGRRMRVHSELDMCCSQYLRRGRQASDSSDAAASTRGTAGQRCRSQYLKRGRQAGQCLVVLESTMVHVHVHEIVLLNTGTGTKLHVHVQEF